ncbi:bfpT-regulated chaperone [Escherichia coli]|nr:bfpT-regulated chaperone [Escherichia coli]EHX2057368.1 bfpT-regulated chaperone [Escherichia coli]EIE2976317.1 bfpT-regulated chaperone [Escherichia coli]EJZ0108726.1 bfpT-regulated chaperone [Escherichia coli]EKI1494849.1 bfpT-regulated chaperone [Escherichia coli]
MPANISGNSVSSLGCSFFSRPSFLGGRKEILQFSMGERVITFSVNQMNKIILNTVTRQSTKDISAWKSDERIVYPSRLINMGIDKHCSENNTNITGDVRQRVFTLIEEDFGIKLDSNAAQSSITHIVNGNGWFSNKLASLCEGMSRDDKNKTREILENKLADRFFEKHIDSKIDIKKLQDSVEGYIILAKAMSAK